MCKRCGKTSAEEYCVDCTRIRDALSSALPRHLSGLMGPASRSQCHYCPSRARSWDHIVPRNLHGPDDKAAYERYAPAWSTVLRIGADLGDGVEVLAPMTLDHIENFIPMGWTASWGEHWYADPRAPLYVRDWGAEVSFDGEHWTNAMAVGTPIYDTLVTERGDPRKN